MELRTRTAKRIAVESPPLWKLAWLDAAEKEARKFLDAEQYAHAVGLMDELAYDTDPHKSQTQDVEKVEEFYELRDKGGVLRKINLRIYFVIHDGHKVIIVLGCDKKEQENQISNHMKRRIFNRAKIVRNLLQKPSGK